MEKTLKEFTENFKKNVAYLLDHKDEGGVIYNYFARNVEGSDGRDYDWAVVIGWTQTGDIDETNKYADDGYQLSAKIGFQPSNSGMQCDLDIDWLTPFDKTSGEVEDADYLFETDSDLDGAAEYLWGLVGDYDGKYGNYQSSMQ